MKHSVLLDTSFFIRLLNDEDKLHNNALGYYKYFLENEITLKVSTITIAEYCVLGKITDLPLTNIQILPFNLKEAQRAGEFANILFTENKVSITNLHPRAIIPNDSKLFAQADIDKTIIHFVTSDVRSKSTLKMLKNGLIPKFEIISINVPFSDTFGILDL
jgi:predicted nucleic acid-binding protein